MAHCGQAGVGSDVTAAAGVWYGTGTGTGDRDGDGGRHRCPCRTPGGTGPGGMPSPSCPGARSRPPRACPGESVREAPGDQAVPCLRVALPGSRTRISSSDPETRWRHRRAPEQCSPPHPAPREAGEGSRPSSLLPSAAPSMGPREGAGCQGRTRLSSRVAAPHAGP